MSHQQSEPGDLCVSIVPLFQGLTYDEQLDVAEVARPLRLQPAQEAYAAGGDASQLMVVHTGNVKISRISAGGHEQLIRVLGPGDFIGETAFLTGARPDHTATAVGPAELCVFRHEDLEILLERHSSIGMRMLQGVSTRLSQAEARLASLLSEDVSARLAGYLLDLPARMSADSPPVVTLPLAKKDIASLLDTTPESLSRQLRALTEAGVVEPRTGNVLAILDVDGLTALTTDQSRQ